MAASNRKMFARLIVAFISKKAARLAIIFLALITGAAITAAMSALYFDINQKMNVELKSYGANFYLGGVQNKNFSQQLLQEVVTLDQDKLTMAYSPYFYTTVRAEQQDVAVVGLDFKSITKVEPYWQTIAGHLLLTDFDDQNAVAGIELARKLNLNVGNKLGLILTNPDGSQQQIKLKIKAIVETGDNTDNMLIVNLFVAQRWANSAGSIHHALFLLNGSIEQIDALAARINSKLPVQASAIRKISQAEGEILPKIKYLMGIVTLVILILSALCVNTALVSMGIERSREFALHKALGASNSAITKLVLAEVGTIALAATVAGLLGGFILAQLLGHAVFNTSIDFRWQILPIVLLCTLLTSLIAATLPLKKIFGISAAATLKGE